MKSLAVCLWFDDQAEDAYAFYQSIFKNIKRLRTTNYSDVNAKMANRTRDSLMALELDIEGLEIMLLNGGPMFKPNPSISLHISCKSVGECDELFNKLSDGGDILMPLDKYPFSEKFGWVNDKYGVSWRVNVEDSLQKITPCIMFQGDASGTAEKAMAHYTSIFDNSRVIAAHKFLEGEGPVNFVKHAVFELNGEQFMAFDSPIKHAFDFSEGVSFIVNCKSQEDIDNFWTRLCEGGRPSQCGWLVDKFGVSWQIVPTVLIEMMQGEDLERYDNLMLALFKMTKLDIETLKAAYACK